MKRLLRFVLASLTCTIAAPALADGTATAGGSVVEVVSASRGSMSERALAFTKPELDTSVAYDATGLVLERDFFDATFESGIIYLLKPIEGQVTGAVFLGRANSTYTAYDKWEAKSIARFTKKESRTLADVSDKMVLQFIGDDTLARIQKQPKIAPSRADEAKAVFAEHMKMLDAAELPYEISMLAWVVDPRPGNSFFWARYAAPSSKQGWLWYLWSGPGPDVDPKPGANPKDPIVQANASARSRASGDLMNVFFGFNAPQPRFETWSQAKSRFARIAWYRSPKPWIAPSS